MGFSCLLTAGCLLTSIEPHYTNPFVRERLTNGPIHVGEHDLRLRQKGGVLYQALLNQERSFNKPEPPLNFRDLQPLESHMF